jgi:hypothetical protein
MAPAPRGRTATKPVEPEIVEDDEDEFEDVEDDDLEELEEEPEAPAPKTKARKAAAPKADGEESPKAKRAPAIEFGSPWLAAHVTEVTGDTYDARAIRMLLRKLAKDGKLDREVGETRERYQFTGPQDTTVKLVVEMVKSGAAKELKQAGLQAVKDQAAAKKAAAAAAKAAAAEAEEMEDDEDDEDVEEAPKPTRRRPAAAKSTAPAKATPATARRKTATAAK